MSEKSEVLYALMLRRGYPEEFSRLIAAEMNTDFTVERMINYISYQKMHRLEDVVDEMLAIRSFRDKQVEKHISEHAQASINNLYLYLNGNDCFGAMSAQTAEEDRS